MNSEKFAFVGMALIVALLAYPFIRLVNFASNVV
jgi:hypothetical protein